MSISARREIQAQLVEAVRHAWNRLAFTIEPQEQSNWCWTACAASVSRFYDSASAWLQCQIVDAELGQSTCCSDGGLPTCNQPWYFDRALERTGNYGGMQGGAAAQAVVQAEIAAKRVVGARVGWQGGGGHFVVIAGCSSGLDEQLEVHDPIYGRTEISRLDFERSYQGTGSWTDTYQTVP